MRIPRRLLFLPPRRTRPGNARLVRPCESTFSARLDAQGRQDRFGDALLSARHDALPSRTKPRPGSELDPTGARAGGREPGGRLRVSRPGVFEVAGTKPLGGPVRLSRRSLTRTRT